MAHDGTSFQMAGNADIEHTGHLAEWFDGLRAFAASDKDEQLCRFHEVMVTKHHTDVEKAFWLKYDPAMHPARVDNLNWFGTPVNDPVCTKPIRPTDLSCDVWLLCCIVRETDPNPPGSYYDEDGDPFDPYNMANWDGDQQVGFRD